MLLIKFLYKNRNKNYFNKNQMKTKIDSSSEFIGKSFNKFPKKINSKYSLESACNESDPNRIIFFKKNKIIQSEKKLSTKILSDDYENFDPNLDMINRYKNKNCENKLYTQRPEKMKMNELIENKNILSKYEITNREINFDKNLKERYEINTNSKRYISIDGKDCFDSNFSNKILSTNDPNVNNNNENGLKIDKNNDEFIAMELEVDYNFNCKHMRSSKNFPLIIKTLVKINLI